MYHGSLQMGALHAVTYIHTPTTFFFFLLIFDETFSHPVNKPIINAFRMPGAGCLSFFMFNLRRVEFYLTISTANSFSIILLEAEDEDGRLFANL